MIIAILLIVVIMIIMIIAILLIVVVIAILLVVVIIAILLIVVIIEPFCGSPQKVRRGSPGGGYTPLLRRRN